MKKGIFILFLTVFSACKQEVEIENHNEIWTESELLELNFIVSEFDRILTTKYKTDSKKKAYLIYSDDILKNQVLPNLNGIDKLTSKIENLTVFDKIWNKHTDIYSEHFNLKIDSCYLKYLNEIGKKTDFIKDYANRLSIVGDIQPSVISGFAKNIKNIDLTDKSNRLIFAIHYLTLINR